jgi:hypothetical protein
MLHKYWTALSKKKNCASSKQTSSLQVLLEPSNDKDHADRNDDCRGNNACMDAVGSDSN